MQESCSPGSSVVRGSPLSAMSCLYAIALSGCRYDASTPILKTGETNTTNQT